MKKLLTPRNHSLLKRKLKCAIANPSPSINNKKKNGCVHEQQKILLQNANWNLII